MSVRHEVRDLTYVLELQSAVQALFSDDSVDDDVERLLEECRTSLVALIRPLRKQPEARQKVQSGEVTLDGTECRINKDFIDDTLKLADYFDINELDAAQYLYIGTQSSTKYDRDAFNSAVFVLLSSHTILYDILLTIVTMTASDTMCDSVLKPVSSFVNTLTDSEEDIRSLLFARMDNLRASIQSVIEAEKKGRLVGVAVGTVDMQFVLRSFLEQHEVICSVLAELCKLKPYTSDDMLVIFSSLKNSEVWDLLTSHRILLIIKAFQYWKISTTSPAENTAEAIEKTLPILRAMVKDLRRAQEWKCKPICSVLQLMISTELNGICNNIPEPASSFDYEQEILSLAKQAIESDCFQHLITFKLFLQNDVQEDHPFGLFFKPNALSHFRVPDVQPEYSRIVDMLESCLRTFCISFIVNFADILKDMRLSSEDLLLSQQVTNDVTTETEDHAEDLFYGVIFTAFSTDDDQAYIFWQDKGGDLYGFLVWASYAEVASTVYAFFTMLSALAGGPQCSVFATEFFDQDQQVVHNPQNGNISTNVTWPFIFNSFQYYAHQLERKPDSKEYQEMLELDPHTALILKAYLCSISSVLSHSQDSKLLLHVYTKYEAISVLFKLLACRMPSEIYCEVFKLLVCFTKEPECLRVTWQYFEAWLRAMDHEMSFVAVAANEKRTNTDHRPLSTLLKFSKLSINSTIEVITCLTSMFNSESSLAGTLTFPENLGVNSRHPGTADYVDFVWNCLLSSQVLESTMTLVQRINMTLACIRFMELSLSSLNLDLIYLSRHGIEDYDQAIHASSLSQYVLLHPGTRILQQFGVLRHRQAVMDIVKSHNSADVTIRKLIGPAVISTLHVITDVLDRMNTYTEFVVPIVKSRVTSSGTLALDVSTDSEFLVSLCMLSINSDAACAAAALLLLESCDKQGLFDERHFTILSCVDESKNILLGFITIVEAGVDHSKHNILRLLRFLVSNLYKATKRQQSVSIAHFILGFAPATASHELSIGVDPGHIGSGRSVLHSLINLLLSTDEQTTNRLEADPCEIFSLASKILLNLCEADICFKLIQPILAEVEFLKSIIQKQISIPLQGRQVECANLVPESTNAMESLLDARTTAMKYCSLQILSSQNSEARQELRQYSKVFFPGQGNRKASGIVLCDFLDVLHLEEPCPNDKILGTYFGLEAYSNLLLGDSPQDTSRLCLALNLRLEMLLRKAEERDRATIREEYNSFLAYLADYKFMKSQMKATRTYLTEWSNLAVVAFDNNNLLEDVQFAKVAASEIVHVLLVRLPSVQEKDHELADIVCQAISALIINTDDRRLEQVLHFMKTIMICLQSPASSQSQRESLYFAGSWCLQSIEAQRKDGQSGTDLSFIAKVGTDRYLTTICRDAVAQEAVVAIAACIFLDLMLKTCELKNNPFLSQRIVGLNLFSRFAHHFEIALGADHPSEALDRQFDLVLRLAMTRAGAQELLQANSLLTALNTKFFSMNEGTEDVSNAIRLLGVYIACMVSLGSHLTSVQTLLSNFASKWSEKLGDHARRMKSAKNPRTGEFEALLDMLNKFYNDGNIV